ncbi:MAG: hypothetical protein A2234_03910 [Elusimicrobia bacterium RIFOXYA2_FULL_58_8]|nr:MAG: hypothetical protein A2285_03030 [Elusimicrobia bacterium RIFOXYA12_FULL_57_11]OGS13542.1 MAG: hypothetical protein A2234_03910 [Elusimicrobia bacterium RIFOXYA2_FULL_58_8]
MTRAAILLAALLAAGQHLQALRPSDQMKSTRSRAVWMTVASLKTGNEYYLEVVQDGRAMLREVTGKTVTTRRGTIPVQLVKDFLRETENSEIIITRKLRQDKTVFYRGELVRISAYISGELTLTEAPLNNFGEAFVYAFGEIRKEVVKLPVETAVAAFLRAEPLEGQELDVFREKAKKDGEVKNIETYDIQKIKPLMAAIKDANRLIPLETTAEVAQLQSFITERQLYGLRTLFYLPSTRGTFKCSVLEAGRRAAAVPDKNKSPKKQQPPSKPTGTPYDGTTPR